MTSQSFFDRFTSPHRSPILPFHSPPRRLPSEYDLDELDPRPEDGLLRQQTPPRERYRTSDPTKARRHKSPEAWNDRASSVGSASKLKPRAMFAGPPPPIAASVVMNNQSTRRDTHRDSPGLMSSSRAKINSVLFDHRAEYVSNSADSIWRSLRRQEKALEGEVQQQLDLQAAGLVAGLGGRPPVGGDFDDYSDAGSSTPTGTFYSTATSKSRMVNSLHVPTRANADGNVIPVRQPKRNRPPGLRAARTGLRKSMIALADLKTEEDSHIDAALALRKTALLQLDRLSSRRENVQHELRALEGNQEEPLGLELRDMSTQHDALTQEIHEMEERLVGMRNRRRLLRGMMEDVRNKREAGLSGFRGALRDADAEVTAIMRRPPIQPLDPEILERTSNAAAAAATNSHEEYDPSAATGNDFLLMIPERRTAEMAKSWWQSEIALLSRRKAQIETERQALEDGGALWAEVMGLVTDFETRLRLAMKTTTPSASPPPSGKGKEKVPSQEDVIREQLPLLEGSVGELEDRMRTAEAKGWNLLICAVGAELEAFREAAELLRGFVDDDDDGEQHEQQQQTRESDSSTQELTQTTSSSEEQQSERAADSQVEEDGDENEVPGDLLVSGVQGRGETQSSEEGGEALEAEPQRVHRGGRRCVVLIVARTTFRWSSSSSATSRTDETAR